nr:DUF6266 family protein [uncultured Carboxylicivirga sp.]
MARYKSINEGSSGRIGNVVTYQMYGKSYMRSLPGQYRDRKSEAQLAQRQKMQLINDFLGPYKDVLRITFVKEAIGRSAYMAAKSYNMLYAIVGEYPNQIIDYSKAIVSKGNVLLPKEAKVTKVQEGLLFEWELDDQADPFDTLLVIANIRGQYNTHFKFTGVERREGSFLWKWDGMGTEKYDIWLVFRDYMERGFSDSLWLGYL